MPERRQAQPPVPEKAETVEEQSELDIDNINGVELPPPPPNYRGMIYDANVYRGDIAEGIERLVNNDRSYTDRRRVPPKRLDRPAFSHFDPPLASVTKQNENGLQRIIDGLREKNFDPGDVLICAMIMLMLNSKSEDDILMVLVLMMLL